MEVTRTFVSKFNEGDVVRCGRLFAIQFELAKVIRLRVTNSSECVCFEYLVEGENGERRWVPECELRENISPEEHRMEILKEKENELRNNKTD